MCCAISVSFCIKVLDTPEQGWLILFFFFLSFFLLYWYLVQRTDVHSITSLHCIALIWKHIYCFWVKTLFNAAFPFLTVLVILLLSCWGPQSTRPDSSQYKDNFDKLAVQLQGSTVCSQSPVQMLPLSAELAAGFAFVCQSAAWLQIGFSPWLTPGQSQHTHTHMLLIFALYVNNECYDQKEGCDQVLSPSRMQLRKLLHTSYEAIKN